MNKIMFNDKLGLTDAVLKGRKTMTRRIAKKIMVENENQELVWNGEFAHAYKVGEVVAVAQSYQTILDTVFGEDQQWKFGYMRDVEESHEKIWEKIKGRTNKMFVRADLMPHQIRITDIKVERLQKISDEDCMREGIVAGELKHEQPNSFISVPLPYGGYVPFTFTNAKSDYLCAKDAFAALIDKISGKGTWEKNPYVFAYTFELLK